MKQMVQHIMISTNTHNLFYTMMTDNGQLLNYLLCHACPPNGVSKQRITSTANVMHYMMGVATVLRA